jgi:hypothetical protein
MRSLEAFCRCVAVTERRRTSWRRRRGDGATKNVAAAHERRRARGRGTARALELCPKTARRVGAQFGAVRLGNGRGGAGRVEKRKSISRIPMEGGQLVRGRRARRNLHGAGAKAVVMRRHRRTSELQIAVDLAILLLLRNSPLVSRRTVCLHPGLLPRAQDPRKESRNEPNTRNVALFARVAL